MQSHSKLAAILSGPKMGKVTENEIPTVRSILNPHQAYFLCHLESIWQIFSRLSGEEGASKRQPHVGAQLAIKTHVSQLEFDKSPSWKPLRAVWPKISFYWVTFFLTFFYPWACSYVPIWIIWICLLDLRQKDLCYYKILNLTAWWLIQNAFSPVTLQSELYTCTKLVATGPEAAALKLLFVCLFLVPLLFAA